jgi:hypothetical protein
MSISSRVVKRGEQDKSRKGGMQREKMWAIMRGEEDQVGWWEEREIRKKTGEGRDRWHIGKYKNAFHNIVHFYYFFIERIQ